MRQHDNCWTEKSMNAALIQRREENHTPQGIQQDDA